MAEASKAGASVEADELARLARGWAGFRVVCQVWAAFSAVAFLAVLVIAPMEGKDVSPAWAFAWACSAILSGGLSLAAGTASAMLKVQAYAVEKAPRAAEATSRRLTTA